MLNLSNFISNGSNVIFLEKIVPLTILYTIILLLYIFKEKLNESTIVANYFLNLAGVIMGVLLVCDLVIRWRDGINIDNLLLDFLTINITLTVLFIFTKIKYIFNLIIFSGVIGGMIGMFINFEYSINHIQYYYYYLGNIFIIIVPLIIFVVQDLKPNLKETLLSFVTIQVFSILMVFINNLANTNYFYLVIDEVPKQLQFLTDTFGDLYLIIIDIILTGLIFIWYVLLKSFKVRTNIPTHVTSTNSAYISKKKNDRFSSN